MCKVTAEELITGEIETGDCFCYGVPFDQIGKTVFLTREEAEAALAAGRWMGE